MAIIDKTTFEIYSGTNIDSFEKDSFECDETIAVPIQILNQKGYRTTFCCSGHPFQAHNGGIIFSKEKPDISIAGLYEIREISENEANENGYFFDLDEDDDRLSEIRSGNLKIFFWKCKFYDSLEAYIAFEDNCIPQYLPDGWYKETNCMKFNFKEKYTSVFDFFQDRLDCMRSLVEWAEKLPKKIN